MIGERIEIWYLYTNDLKVWCWLWNWLWSCQSQNSGYSPILQFSIVLHFPMCSVERESILCNMGAVMGWWLTLSVDSSGTNMLLYSSIFHVIALPWLWTQTCTSEFLPGRVMGFGYNSILGWLCIYDSPPINIWYLDLATIYSGQIIKSKIWRRVSYEPWMHRSTRPWSGRTICLQCNLEECLHKPFY